MNDKATGNRSRGISSKVDGNRLHFYQSIKLKKKREEKK